jgi:hypothetical protein
MITNVSQTRLSSRSNSWIFRHIHLGNYGHIVGLKDAPSALPSTSVHPAP